MFDWLRDAVKLKEDSYSVLWDFEATSEGEVANVIQFLEALEVDLTCLCNVPLASGLGRLANRGGGPSLKQRGLEGVFQLQEDHNPRHSRWAKPRGLLLCQTSSSEVTGLRIASSRFKTMVLSQKRGENGGVSMQHQHWWRLCIGLSSQRMS